MSSPLEENTQVFYDEWAELDLDHKRKLFLSMPRPDAEDLFLSRSAEEQHELLSELPLGERRSWIRLLPLDDTADLLQTYEADEREAVMSLLDPQTTLEVKGLLAYAEDDAGGLMNPHYIRIRQDMTVEEAIRYLRAQAKTSIETIYYAYVLDTDQHLVGVVSFRDLLLSTPQRRVSEIMTRDIISIQEDTDREEVSRLVNEHQVLAIPVLDKQGRMKGIVTFDDIAQVAEQEATEDIQKLGAVEALEASYLKTTFFEMIKKRAGWLVILFVGESFTTYAMSHYEDQIARAVVLSLFIPLIISSGGNSGSQASTLIIRALALRELRLRDWWRVLYRELGTGLILGLILGVIGFARVALGGSLWGDMAEHATLLGLAVAISLLGVVIWGTLVGSMLPFVLRRFQFDPASASAPFVATIVDVTGLIIYFSAAGFVLAGRLG